MRIKSPGYTEPIELSPLETALYESVASELEATAEQVALVLFGRYGIPSDAFYAAYDNEVSRLRARYLSDTQA